MPDISPDTSVCESTNDVVTNRYNKILLKISSPPVWINLYYRIYGLFVVIL